MKAGPPRAELGIASCPNCGDPVMRVATNKHGYPCAYCKTCDTQTAPRAELGSLKLLGRIHTWQNTTAAELMLGPDDRAALAGPGKLPPHLARPRTPTSAPPSSTPRPELTTTPAPPVKPKGWLDKEL